LNFIALVGVVSELIRPVDVEKTIVNILRLLINNDYQLQLEKAHVKRANESYSQK